MWRGLPVICVLACGAQRAPSEPTFLFDADRELALTWKDAHEVAPDGVVLRLSVTHVDEDANVHYADDGTLDLIVFSADEIRHEPRGECENLWEIAGPVATDIPEHPDLHIVPEWRSGDCSTDRSIAKLHCGIAEIWQRAIEKGVPRDGLATIEAKPNPDGGVTWSFEKKPRYLNFEDDCGRDR